MKFEVLVVNRNILSFYQHSHLPAFSSVAFSFLLPRPSADPSNPKCVSWGDFQGGISMGESWLWLGMGFGHLCGKRWMVVSGVDVRWRVLGLWGSWDVRCWAWAPKWVCPNPKKKNYLALRQKSMSFFYHLLWSKGYLECSSNNENLPPSTPGLNKLHLTVYPFTLLFSLMTYLLPHLNTIIFVKRATEDKVFECSIWHGIGQKHFHLHYEKRVWIWWRWIP